MPVRQIERPAAQRASGVLALAFKRSQGTTRISTFYQQGCLKARLPRPQVAEICEAVTVNISGGIAGGDALTTSIDLGAGSAVVIASQAAERVYRALNGDTAGIATRISLGAGAMLDYLPQETILFDGFALERSLDIDLAWDAKYLGFESIVFGRLAMGEMVRSGWLRDRILLRRDGVLTLQDMTRLDGDIAGILGRRAVAGGGMAMANVIYAAPDAETLLPHVGASVMDSILRSRILAPDAASLRNCVMTVLKLCRQGRALPRVWQG
jgi:urease accessory protein